MGKYSDNLPMLRDNNSEFFLTDGGLETMLTFDKGMDLPEFASFVIMKDEEGRKIWNDYTLSYINLAKKFKAAGYVLETPTYKASEVWANRIGGITKEEVMDINKVSVEQALTLRQEHETEMCPIVIGGTLGPKGDGYNVGKVSTVDEAQVYHSSQVKALAEAGADFINVWTMNHPDEAVGIANACAELDIPVVMSFTVETDGKLPSGVLLKDAVLKVDKESKVKPVYYMINCAHYDHFMDQFRIGKEDDWIKRIKSVMANPSRKSHAELNGSTSLDQGDPEEFGRLTAEMRRLMPWMKVFGGCCGTDEKHLQQIGMSMQTFK